MHLGQNKNRSEVAILMTEKDFSSLFKHALYGRYQFQFEVFNTNSKLKQGSVCKWENVQHKMQKKHFQCIFNQHLAFVLRLKFSHSVDYMLGVLILNAMRDYPLRAATEKSNFTPFPKIKIPCFLSFKVTLLSDPKIPPKSTKTRVFFQLILSNVKWPLFKENLPPQCLCMLYRVFI